MQKLTAEMILQAYRKGFFPMADSADSEDIYWYDPEYRGQLSISHLHVPKRLQKTIRKMPYRIGFNYDFSGVIKNCAALGHGRQETWINPVIRNAFQSLHRAGYAHSVEAWHKNELVGGLYGLAVGGAFFGESMFSYADNASKICLVYLAEHLKKQGFILLDTQFVNDHLKQFGVYELPRDEYIRKLEKAIALECDFVPVKYRQSSSKNSISSEDGLETIDSSVSFPADDSAVGSFLQSITQTS